MKKIVLYLVFLFSQLSVFSQENTLPNQITLWNPFDMQFTQDNKYLVVSSPNDSKIWSLENKECIAISPNFYKDVNANDNSWAYLSDSNSFFFHQTILGNEMYAINPDRKSKTLVASLGGGKYQGFSFDYPSTYFLTSDILLCIRNDKRSLPYISIEKVGETTPIFTAKIEGNNEYDKSNKNFTVLKGDTNRYYLLSFRSAANSKNGEGIVTEINLDTQKTKVLAKGMEVYIGDDSYTASRIEKLKRSIETPHYIIMYLDDFVYVIRKSDGKILENLNIKSKFPENSFPEICGERDGKLIVRSFDIGNDGGILFHTFDFDSQAKIEEVLRFTIDISSVKGLKTAISHNGKEFAIAYKWDLDKGYKVAYIDTQKMTMLRDNANLVENFLKEQEVIIKKNEIARTEKTNELSKKSKEEVVSRVWYAIIDKGNDHFGMGINLTSDAYGNISGIFNYRYSPSGMPHTNWYDAIYNISGSFINENTFNIKVDSIKFSHEYFGDKSVLPEKLTFQIYLDPNTNLYSIYCKEWSGYFQEGYVDSHYF